MAQAVKLIDPNSLKRNPENPRLIFHEDELLALQDSIEKQGILVPLTVYELRAKFILLDGERRWRCALKLGLRSVPIIIQPKPDRLQNIMMMFAIHNSRKDWDPLPTAMKLEELEAEFSARNGRKPTEVELSGIASLSRGEIRRLRKLLRLPEKEKRELMAELEKPRHLQRLTVDHVLEATKGAEALKKKNVIDGRQEQRLRRAIIRKFRSGTIKNTVAPRKLARMARAVERGDIPASAARKAAARIIEDPAYTIDAAFEHTVERLDFQHSVAQLVGRLVLGLESHERRDYDLSDDLRESLSSLHTLIKQLLSR